MVAFTSAKEMFATLKVLFHVLKVVPFAKDRVPPTELSPVMLRVEPVPMLRLPPVPAPEARERVFGPLRVVRPL